MQSIVQWLDRLGLAEYAQRFADNDIDVSVLGLLSDQDLKDLGVSLGHRRKLLAAIRDISGAAPAAPQSADETAAVRQEQAERRQVTVLFSDLVGSTELSARLDPEDLREVVSAYHQCVAETVQRLGGFVAKYMGDGVLVYFGYPQAHEDDVERAVQAGLELNAAVTRLQTRASLQSRVGIATGMVVVGDLIGSGEAQERGIVGETPNLAARLQGIAEPNTVVIAEGTRKLLGRLFELQDLGARAFKGMAASVPTWLALRASSSWSRFEALHASGLTSFVGREEEGELLQRRWLQAKAGEGQVILLSGEAGVGKSRLTAALLEAIAPEPHTRMRYFCSPQHTDTAFHPIIEQMERAAGLAHNDTAPVKLDKLDALLARTSTSGEDAALFAELLSLRHDGRYPALSLFPQQRRERTMEALSTQAKALAAQNPLLMIFEDAQWSDPTSLEAFGRAVNRIATVRALLLATYRPEFDPPWIRHPHVIALTLPRLGEREVGKMIDRIAGGKRLPPNIRRNIIERTDGIPLFVEEITKAVLESQDHDATERAIAAISPTMTQVPATLHATLMARLDRVGAAKEIAQIGALIGREFPHSLLAAVARKPEAQLDAALERLLEAGLLFRRGVPPHATYLFKHALVQDAARSTLLREPRRALHARIAETLESEFADIAERQPELLARHCTEAGLIEKAAPLWGKAGQRSLDRSALIEAVEQLTRALTQIAELPGTPTLRREAIKLQVALITALMHVKGYAATETKAAVERARLLIEQAETLGEPPEDPLLLFSVLYGFWVANVLAFSGDICRELAAQFLALAAKQQTTAPRMIGHRLMGVSLLFTGDVAEARAHLDRALSLYDPVHHRPLVTRFGQESGVVILSYRSLALWMLGYPEAALADAARAIADARAVGQAATLMFTVAVTVSVLIQCKEYAAANAQLDEIAALATEKGALLWKAVGTLHRGCVLTLTGQPAEAVRVITSGIADLGSTGAKLYMPLWLPHLARAYADLGEFDHAWRSIGEGTAAVENTGERMWEADLNRMAGEIALKSPNPDASKAEMYFDRALAVARAQHAKSWELRAAMNMARLWCDQGKRDAARKLLAPVHGAFTEGLDTADLQEAKALLNTLGA